MITLNNVAKSYGAQTLFEGAHLQINERDRFALVGPNGAGKSTLFKMILGQEQPDEGEVTLRSGVSFGYLPQETPSLSGKSALMEILDDNLEDNRREAQGKKILMGLGFKIKDFDRPVSEFSGGWQMRVMIAKLLLQEPDLLLLDEPTNHLDLESLLWFQEYLQNYRGALFIISHDREFINSTTDRIVELRQGKLHVYTGTFEDYLDQKKQEEERLISAYKRQQKEIKDLETYITRFRAKASLAASVQSKIKYLEKMEKIELPPDQKTVGFSFPQPHRSGQNVLVLKDIRQSYDGKNFIYDGLNMILERGQKIALVGPNGAGKSTLLKLLAGILPFQTGERKLGINVDSGYFSQHRADMFNMDRTVFDEAKTTRRAHSETGIRTLLGSFLLSGDAAFKKVSVLSGGEKSRLGLVKILLDPPNLLLMDEPTTHLDMASVEILIEALKNYEGTFVFISHDVYFIRQLANNIIHVDSGKTTWYPGDYDYFLHRMAQKEGEEGELFRAEERIEAVHHHSKGGIHGSPNLPDRQARNQSGASRSPSETTENNTDKPKNTGYKSKEQKRKEAEERNARYRQAQLDKARQVDIDRLKKEEESILQEMADPHTHQNPDRVKELTRRLGELKKKLS